MVSVAVLSVMLVGAGKFEPPPGKTMVLVGCGWDDSYQKYQEATGHEPAGGVFWYEPNGDTNYFRHNARQVGPNGVLLIHFLLITDNGNYVPKLISGEQDDELERLGAAFKEWGGPVYLVVGTEFDHKAHIKDFTPQQYVRAFKRIRDVWGRQGVTNVAYVWHSVCDDITDRTWAFYPGDRYVDWFAISLYYDYQARQAPRFARMAKSRRKPLMIVESGPPNGKVRRFDDWHAPFLRTARGLGARVICYNNFNRGAPVEEPFKNSAMHLMPGRIAKDWGREMQKPTYLKAGEGLYADLGVEDTLDSLVQKAVASQRGKR